MMEGLNDESIKHSERVNVMKSFEELKNNSFINSVIAKKNYLVLEVTIKMSSSPTFSFKTFRF